MNPPSDRYLARAQRWLEVTTLAYFVMNGAQIFETTAVVPSWAADPPASLALLREPHGLDFQTFWITFHSLHELTLVVAVVVTWRLRSVRGGLLALLAVHVAVRVWTVAYFAPTIIGFQTSPLVPGPDAALTGQVSMWQDLNYVRVVLFVLVSLGLLPLLRRVTRMRDGAGGHDVDRRGAPLAPAP